MKKNVYIILMVAFFMSGCKGQSQQLDCLNNELLKLKQEPVYALVKNGLDDTLQNWIVKGIEGVQVLKKLNWKIDDAVFFAPNFDKAILLILQQDTAKYQVKRFETDSLELTSLDYIDMIYANKESDGWHYYYQSMPSLVVPRERYNRVTPMTFEELSEIGRKEILKGYYKRGTCEYNEKFFDRWDITNLKQKHQRFITNDY